MKSVLATESQSVALALQLIKSMTGEAVESICTKYSQRAPWWALLRRRCSLWKMFSGILWEERESGKGEGQGGRKSKAASTALKSKLTSKVTSSKLKLEV